MCPDLHIYFLSQSHPIPSFKPECSPFTCNTNMIVWQTLLSFLFRLLWYRNYSYIKTRILKMYRFLVNSQLLEAVGKLHNILQKGSLGWDSLILVRHILCHRREQILSHRRIFGKVLASRHLYPHRTDQDGSILHQQLENKLDGAFLSYVLLKYDFCYTIMIFQ